MKKLYIVSFALLIATLITGCELEKTNTITTEKIQIQRFGEIVEESGEEHKLSVVLDGFTMPETTDWNIYTNEEYAFSIKYPNNYKLEEKSLTHKENTFLTIYITDENIDVSDRRSRRIMLSPNSDLAISFGFENPWREYFFREQGKMELAQNVATTFSYSYSTDGDSSPHEYFLSLRFEDVPENWIENQQFANIFNASSPEELHEMYTILNTFEFLDN